jgi:hypothetical protein
MTPLHYSLLGAACLALPLLTACGRTPEQRAAGGAALGVAGAAVGAVTDPVIGGAIDKATGKGTAE